jgi:glycosyltransferase involved in cell wall biosynthesis
MRLGIVAPPFIAIPPNTYGGIELFIDVLVRHLTMAGVDVTLYTNGDSTVDVDKRFLFPHGEWPIDDLLCKGLKEIHHVGWAVADASRTCDVIHLNSPVGPSFAQLVKTPVVVTIHHPMVAFLREHYLRNQALNYITLSEFQKRQAEPLDSSVIYHGLDLECYSLVEKKEEYVCALSRICPDKGTHLAIECARQLGMPLKIGGDLQPEYKAYFQEKIEPCIDGKFIQYVGEVNSTEKLELLGNASAMLFPVDWDEPFGLVMLEAMACGTPVLGLRRGAVGEIVEDGVSGFACGTLGEIVDRFEEALTLCPARVREYVERRFSAQRMALDHLRLYEQLLEESPAAVGKA